MRTQHGGWYVGILANGLAFVSGAFAVLFGRGNVLGPTNNQLAMAAIDERQFPAITPAVGPYQVGLTPRGERVMRTPRPATFSEAHMANAGAFTRRDVDDEEIAMTAREYGVGDRRRLGPATRSGGGAAIHRRGGGDGRRRGRAEEEEAREARGRPRGGRRRPRRAARRRQTGLGGVQGAVLEVANLALPATGWRRRWFGSKVRPGDARYVAERNQWVGGSGTSSRFASGAGVTGRGVDAAADQGGDASARSDRSDDSAEAARAPCRKRPPAFKKPSAPPPRPTPVFQFSNPLAAGPRTAGGRAFAVRAPPFEAGRRSTRAFDEPPADFEWNPLETRTHHAQ